MDAAPIVSVFIFIFPNFFQIFQAGCSKSSSGKAATSEGPRRYLPHFVRPFALLMGLGERKSPSSPKLLLNLEGLNDVRTPPADFFSIRLVEYHGFSAIHQDPPFDMAAHSPGQDNLLQIPSLPHEIIDGIPVPHTYDVLLDDGAFIQIVRGIVRRRSDDFHTPVIGLPIGIGADESRQEGVMDIDDWTADL